MEIFLSLRDVSTVNCFCCLSSNVNKFGDYNWGFEGQSYRLTQCENCFTSFTDPLPKDSVLENLYSTFPYQWYQDHYHFKKKDARSRLKQYWHHLKSPILDYGGGLGYFSEECRQNNFSSIVYDPFLRSKNLPLSPEWNTVVALHVLEHSNDLERTLNDIKAKMSPGGKLILAVPNGIGQGYTTQKMRWVWAQPPLLHVFHFTRKGLKSLLERNGFTVEWTGYCDRWDANFYADIKWAFLFRRLDSSWSVNSNSVRRRYISYRNGMFRNACLQLSKLRSFRKHSLSELQIVARIKS